MIISLCSAEVGADRTTDQTAGTLFVHLCHFLWVKGQDGALQRKRAQTGKKKKNLLLLIRRTKERKKKYMFALLSYVRLAPWYFLTWPVFLPFFILFYFYLHSGNPVLFYPKSNV